MSEQKTREELLGSGFASQVEAAGDKPVLASLTTTTDLLRNLVSDALARRGLYLEGKLSPGEAQTEDITACRDLADLLQGRGPRAEAFFIQPWNSAEQLGQFLVDSYDLPCKADESVFTFCLNLLTEIYDEVDDIAKRELSIDEEGWRLDGIIERYAHAFTGIPYPSDDDEA